MFDVIRLLEELGKIVGKDVMVGKLMYLKVMGVEKLREYVERLNREVREYFCGFDLDKVVFLLFLVD